LSTPTSGHSLPETTSSGDPSIDPASDTRSRGRAPVDAPATAGVTATTFDSLELPEVVRAGIRDAGFTHCTPIQEKVLPLTLRGRDVAGQAQTGTGKTAAFLITVFTKLVTTPRPYRPASPRALIVAPTRELVVQIASDADQLGRHTRLVTHAVYGGIDYKKQRDQIQGEIDVLIGTPGRLIDYFKQEAYTLRRAEALVIDEADRMFDMGFIRDLRFLLRRLPPAGERQSMLFSATLSYQVLELAYEHMDDPVHVSASDDAMTPDRIDHHVYHVGVREKPSLLIGLLAREAGERTLIFTNMRRTAQHLVDVLGANGVAAGVITGDLDQRQRLRMLDQFKTAEVPVLIATDVASRGLHIPGVTHVINYDIPQDPEDYIHRTGRTARAGAAGKAFSLASEYDAEYLEPIESLVGFKLPHTIPEENLFATGVEVPRPRRHGAPRRNGGRPQGPHRPRSGDGHPRSSDGPRQAQGQPDGRPRGNGRPRRRRNRRRPSSSPS
jgi:ATP-dependent RNA helicase RhlB